MCEPTDQDVETNVMEALYTLATPPAVSAIPRAPKPFMNSPLLTNYKSISIRRRAPTIKEKESESCSFFQSVFIFSSLLVFNAFASLHHFSLSIYPSPAILPRKPSSPVISEILSIKSYYLMAQLDYSYHYSASPILN